MNKQNISSCNLQVTRKKKKK